MILSDKGLSGKKEWTDKGYALPEFDRQEMIENTKKEPLWVHFGAGNIFRAFQAAAAQKLLNEGVIKSGITVVEGFDYEIIEKMYRPHDNLSILVTLKSDGSVEKTVVGSIGESCILDSDNDKEFSRLKEIFASPTLQFATFTITEKGYSLVDGKGNIIPAVEKDFNMGPEKCGSYMGKVTALLHERFKAGALPIAMLSTDNCSHNGDKLKEAVHSFAEKWEENGVSEKGFLAYIDDSAKVSYPWSMIDKITPRPDDTVQKILDEDGVEGLDSIITSKNTYVAPFVNAEECEYLVIEDSFPAGRPELEKAGFIFTDRETVDKVERMKVCTCLNPLHTCLAVYGCLLGFKKISDEMEDSELKEMVRRIGYEEGLPVVTDPGVLDPKEFIDTVINIRFPNPFIPDTPQRIATDTSQKLPIRFGETVKNYISSGRDLGNLRLIPLVFAGWVRYLMAVDDEGNSFELSPDPLLETVKPFVSGISLGDPDADISAVDPLLSNASIFGVNLFEAGLGDRVKDYFKELIAGKGAVRATLKKYIGGNYGS